MVKAHFPAGAGHNVCGCDLRFAEDSKEQMNVYKYVLAWGFALCGGWFLYWTISLLILQMPLSSVLIFIAALMAFAASHFSWKQQWYITAVFFLLLVVISDMAAVFYAGQR
jgi:hypothetical protein